MIGMTGVVVISGPLSLFPWESAAPISTWYSPYPVPEVGAKHSYNELWPLGGRKVVALRILGVVATKAHMHANNTSRPNVCCYSKGGCGRIIRTVPIADIVRICKLEKPLTNKQIVEPAKDCPTNKAINEGIDCPNKHRTYASAGVVTGID